MVFSLSKMAAAILESEKTTLGTRLEITLLPQLNGHHLQFAILYFDYEGKKTCLKQAAKLFYIRKMFNWLWIFKIRYKKRYFCFDSKLVYRTEFTWTFNLRKCGRLSKERIVGNGCFVCISDKFVTTALAKWSIFNAWSVQLCMGY